MSPTSRLRPTRAPERLRATLLRGAVFPVFLLCTQASAGDVDVVSAEFRSADENTWRVQVTLAHADTGWDHYADSWRIVDASGKVLATRVLHHPHVNEQPFTRGLDGVLIEDTNTPYYVEAHDKQHGWSTSKLEVNLEQAIDGRLKVGSGSRGQ